MGLGNVKPLPRHVPAPASLALAGIIYEGRRRRRWTLDELAIRSGVSRQMLGFIETHQRKATTDTLERIARAFRVSAARLFAAAEERASLWPKECQKCYYSCVERGRLKWWNRARGRCSRR